MATDWTDPVVISAIGVGVLEKNILGSPQKVVIAVVQSEDRFLLVRRKAAEGRLAWNFPGGKIEAGETELAAAEREVFDETGSQVRWLKPASVMARITSNIYAPVKDLLQTASQRELQPLSSI